MTTSPLGSSAPGIRRRVSWTERQAAVARLDRLARGGRPSPRHVEQVAQQHGVTVRAVYGWFADPRLRGQAEPSRKRYEPSLRDLAVLATQQNRWDAWELLGKIDTSFHHSYRTFARGLSERTDPAMLHGSLDGWTGLANNRAYLPWAPAHRNYLWHLDHTTADVFVWPSHKELAPIRPEITVIVDGAHSLTHIVPWKSPVDAEMVAAALVEFGLRRQYFGVEVGGQPEQVLLDNAKSHFAGVMTEGVTRLGWILAPTMPFSSWQNGKAESANRLFNNRLCKKLPGALHAGTTRSHRPRAMPVPVEKLKPKDVLPWVVFENLVQDMVDKLNTTQRMKRLGGMTRLQSYADDPTEQRMMDPIELRTAFLSSGTITPMYTKNGMEFRKNSYFGPNLHVGRRYRVRYLPTDTDFIEVFSIHNEWVCTAVRAERMSPEMRKEFMMERARTEREYNAIAAGDARHLKHLAQAAHQMTETGAADSPPRTQILGVRDGVAQPAEEPKGPIGDDEARRHGGEQAEAATTSQASDHSPDLEDPTPTGTSTDAVAPRPRRRPQVPRVHPPTPVGPPAAIDPRLAEKFGQHLNTSPAPPNETA